MTDYYYDRQGDPMTEEAHMAAVLESRREGGVYGPPIRVGWTELDNGITVSTVWTGRDARGMARYGEPAEIFETLAWDAVDREIERENYTTEAEAYAGHERTVAALGEMKSE